MTVYCYRCGDPIQLEPKVKSLRVWDGGTVRVTFEEEIASHHCSEIVQDQR